MSSHYDAFTAWVSSSPHGWAHFQNEVGSSRHREVLISVVSSITINNKYDILPRLTPLNDTPLLIRHSCIYHFQTSYRRSLIYRSCLASPDIALKILMLLYLKWLVSASLSGWAFVCGLPASTGMRRYNHQKCKPREIHGISNGPGAPSTRQWLHAPSIGVNIKAAQSLLIEEWW